MTTTTATTSTESRKFRWLYILMGIILFVFGVGIIRYPAASYYGLAMYFSIIIIVIGISEMMNAYAQGSGRYRGWGLLMGILDLAFGFILLLHPVLAEEILPYIIGFILMFKSINYIAEGMQMVSTKIGGGGWIITAGIVTLIFSFMIVFHPFFGIFNIIIWTGLSFMFAGISSFVYAFIEQ